MRHFYPSTLATIKPWLLSIALAVLIPATTLADDRDCKDLSQASRERVEALQQLLNTPCNEPLKLMEALAFTLPSEFVVRFNALNSFYQETFENELEPLLLPFEILQDDLKLLIEEAIAFDVVMPKDAQQKQGQGGAATLGYHPEQITFDKIKIAQAKSLGERQARILRAWIKQQKIFRKAKPQLAQPNRKIAKLLAEVLATHTTFADRQQELTRMFNSGEFAHCLGKPQAFKVGEGQPGSVVAGGSRAFFTVGDVPEEGIDPKEIPGLGDDLQPNAKTLKDVFIALAKPNVPPLPDGVRFLQNGIKLKKSAIQIKITQAKADAELAAVEWLEPIIKLGEITRAIGSAIASVPELAVKGTVALVQDPLGAVTTAVISTGKFTGQVLTDIAKSAVNILGIPARLQLEFNQAGQGQKNNFFDKMQAAGKNLEEAAEQLKKANINLDEVDIDNLPDDPNELDRIFQAAEAEEKRVEGVRQLIKGANQAIEETAKTGFDALNVTGVGALGAFFKNTAANLGKGLLNLPKNTAKQLSNLKAFVSSRSNAQGLIKQFDELGKPRQLDEAFAAAKNFQERQNILQQAAKRNNQIRQQIKGDLGKKATREELEAAFKANPEFLANQRVIQNVLDNGLLPKIAREVGDGLADPKLFPAFKPSGQAVDIVVDGQKVNLKLGKFSDNKVFSEGAQKQVFGHPDGNKVVQVFKQGEDTVNGLNRLQVSADRLKNAGIDHAKVLQVGKQADGTPVVIAERIQADDIAENILAKQGGKFTKEQTEALADFYINLRNNKLLFTDPNPGNFAFVRGLDGKLNVKVVDIDGVVSVDDLIAARQAAGQPLVIELPQVGKFDLSKPNDILALQKQIAGDPSGKAFPLPFQRQFGQIIGQQTATPTFKGPLNGAKGPLGEPGVPASFGSLQKALDPNLLDDAIKRSLKGGADDSAKVAGSGGIRSNLDSNLPPPKPPKIPDDGPPPAKDFPDFDDTGRTVQLAASNGAPLGQLKLGKLKGGDSGASKQVFVHPHQNKVVQIFKDPAEAQAGLNRLNKSAERLEEAGLDFARIRGRAKTADGDVVVISDRIPEDQIAANLLERQGGKFTGEQTAAILEFFDGLKNGKLLMLDPNPGNFAFVRNATGRLRVKVLDVDGVVSIDDVLQARNGVGAGSKIKIGRGGEFDLNNPADLAKLQKLIADGGGKLKRRDLTGGLPRALNEEATILLGAELATPGFKGATASARANGQQFLSPTGDAGIPASIASLSGRLDDAVFSGSVADAAKLLDHRPVKNITLDNGQQLSLGSLGSGTGPASGTFKDVFRHPNGQDVVQVFKDTGDEALLNLQREVTSNARLNSAGINVATVKEIRRTADGNIIKIVEKVDADTIGSNVLRNQGGKFTVEQQIALRNTFQKLSDNRLLWLDPNPGNFSFLRAADGSLDVKIIDLDSVVNVDDALRARARGQIAQEGKLNNDFLVVDTGFAGTFNLNNADELSRLQRAIAAGPEGEILGRPIRAVISGQLGADLATPGFRGSAFATANKQPIVGLPNQPGLPGTFGTLDEAVDQRLFNLSDSEFAQLQPSPGKLQSLDQTIIREAPEVRAGLFGDPPPPAGFAGDADLIAEGLNKAENFHVFLENKRKQLKQERLREIRNQIRRNTLLRGKKLKAKDATSKEQQALRDQAKAEAEELLRKKRNGNNQEEFGNDL